ncbi:MAG: site-specific integrase [Peptococcaceae bacterium]|nr:site-specific integrase [Peptococcaceae bacterium]
MASIIKRSENNYSVVYYYTNNNGAKKQKWEAFATLKAAQKRKAEVEYLTLNGRLKVNDVTTLNELLTEYIDIHGESKWSVSTYHKYCKTLNKYVRPFIGEMELQQITARSMGIFYKQLANGKMGVSVTIKMIKEINKILRSAFNYAIRLDLMEKNPLEYTNFPKTETAERNIWNMTELDCALSHCQDSMLYLMINLIIAGSLRVGELLALTWDCVLITEDSILNGSSYILVNKTLERVNREAMQNLKDRDILYKFPPEKSVQQTVVVLKTPKTASSVRKIYLPVTVSKLLLKHRKDIENTKLLLGHEYMDHNLVCASWNGMPLSPRYINDGLHRLSKEANVPDITSHGLRHSSITLKLRMSGGDIKAVQGDSGHAQAKMVTDLYAHIVDEDRRKTAELFEELFYKKRGDDKET